MTDAEAARSALEDTRRVRAEMADKLACPPGWHLVFGALMGTIVAAQAATPFYTIAIEVGCAIATGILAATWKRRLGFFINGYRRGRTRWVTFPLLAGFLAIYALVVYLKIEHGLWQAPLAGGAVMGALAAWASVIWQKVYRAEMLGEERGR